MKKNKYITLIASICLFSNIISMQHKQNILDLPNEMLIEITNKILEPHIDNWDLYNGKIIKEDLEQNLLNLALVCKDFSSIVETSIDILKQKIEKEIIESYQEEYKHLNQDELNTQLAERLNQANILINKRSYNKRDYNKSIQYQYNLKEIIKLIFAGADIDIRNKDNESALMLVIKNDYTYIAKLLTNKHIKSNNSDFNEPNDNGNTPLLSAIKHNNAYITRLLINSGASIDTFKDVKTTPLIAAIRNNNIELAKLILKMNPQNINIKDYYDDTALACAVDINNIELINLLINDHKIDTKRSNIGIALVNASRGKLDIIKLFISKGIEVDAKCRSGDTALMIAAYWGHKDIVKFLIDKGANIDATNNYGFNALMNAILGGRKDIAEFLINEKANLNTNTLGQRNETALAIAIISNNYDIVQLLIKAGVDIDTKSHGTLKENALNYAINKKVKSNIIKLIAENSNNINAQDRYIRTALDYAIITGNEKIFKFLIDKGAKSSETDFTHSELLEALDKNYTNIAKFLIDKVCINARNKRGQTTLIIASKKNNIDIVALLISKGADITIKDIWGYTAIDYATRNKNWNIVKLLTTKDKLNI